MKIIIIFVTFQIKITIKSSKNIRERKYSKSLFIFLWLDSSRKIHQKQNRNEKEQIKGGNYESGTHRREGIAGVGNQHASFANSAVTDRHALDEPGRAHFHKRSTRSPLLPPPTPTMPLLLSSSLLSLVSSEKREITTYTPFLAKIRNS